MIYRVYFWYTKRNSRKVANKCELTVFARDRGLATKLVEDMISNFDIEPDTFSIMRTIDNKSLQDVYNERPELIGISPDKGYIYDEFSQKMFIQRYLK